MFDPPLNTTIGLLRNYPMGQINRLLLDLSLLPLLLVMEIRFQKEGNMTPKEAQDIAERWINFHSDEVTIDEIKSALICLANWYEDNRKFE